ncbi:MULTISPECIES: sensor domain-containing protein [unclassified Pseudoalteromonas]|uniref:sensor domain-containing protein n=1 Tax=unclassified Pseudoalteromonas TaxID=194690 RepID=UPI000CF6B01E|nr:MULTISPECIES: bifunctional diguanylate cyclase/phosphodiesterase [unclassified Pseudoalteromonas]MBS3797931.1 EAL domain-containing protein [Pseudoalteromonas sp. BDTF-M6]
MFDINKIYKGKIFLFAVVISAFSTLAMILVYKLFAQNMHDIAKVLFLLCTQLLLTMSLLLFVIRKVNKHAAVIKRLLNSINDVVLIKDYHGNFKFCNDTMAKLYNCSPEQMVGKDDYYFTQNQEQADFFKDNVQGIMRRFEIEEVYESSTDANTGEIRHFHSVKVPFRDVRNQLHIAVIAKDITEITRLKEEADRNKKRLEHVLDVSEEGLWEWNVQTNQVLHNRQWELITGIEHSDKSFQEFESCIVPEDRPMVAKVLKKLLQDHQSYSIEFRMKKPSGEVIWIWDRGRVAEFDDNNQPLWLVGLALDITEEKNNQDKIVNLAYFDQLTGLLNRAQLEIELEKTIKANQKSNSFSALLFLDLDRFKLLNDSFGHHIGDQLLKVVAERLKQINQDRGIISRFGGDEFVIVLPHLNMDQAKALHSAEQFAERVLKEISKSTSLASDVQDIDVDYSITGSIGGVVFTADDLCTMKLLQLADMALYRTKASGGQKAMIFDTNMQDELRQISELQKAMHDSITNRDFCIYLQPKFDMNETLIGAEALVRWQHPSLGILSPDVFMHMAEESNLIVPIGAIVLERACQQLEQWQSQAHSKHLHIAVNLSAKEIWRAHFVEDFIKVVEQYQIDHSKLIVEVTESVLIRDINDATEKLNKLREFGVSIALDDFGTGYSSLSYLRSLPIDEIKIDRTFVQDMVSDEHAHLVVKSIIDLANNFNLTVVAEGVEMKEHFNLLKSYKVDSYQGYYFSKPVSATELERLFMASDSKTKTEQGESLLPST